MDYQEYNQVKLPIEPLKSIHKNFFIKIIIKQIESFYRQSFSNKVIIKMNEYLELYEDVTDFSHCSSSSHIPDMRFHHTNFYYCNIIMQT